METNEAIMKYYVELIKCLPMDQLSFRAQLTAVGLLHRDLKENVLSKPTRGAMAEYFLDYGINNDAESFSSLITVMQKSEYDQLKVLATRIKSCIGTG